MQILKIVHADFSLNRSGIPVQASRRFNVGIDGKYLEISPNPIFNARLRYLSQSHYQKLLVRNESQWYDTLDVSVNEHQFLLYASKYWDKHLREVPVTDALREKVAKFLLSSNYETCIQAQSLWVGAQFEVFRVTGEPVTNTYLRRSFPVWFIHDPRCHHPSHTNLWRDYRVFLHEWRYFLKCGTCENSRCRLLPYVGELDRCWWPALGEDNFMSKYQSRYASFVVEKSTMTGRPCMQSFEGVSRDGRTIKLVRLL